MKKLLLITITVLLAAVILVGTAYAVMVKNTTNQRLVIRLNQGKTLSLAPGSTAQVTDNDLNAPGLQNLIQKGSVVVVGPNVKQKPVNKGKYK